MLQLIDVDGGGAAAPLAVAGLAAAARQEGLVWVDAVDPTTDEVQALAHAFGWHPLLAEDVAHRGQRQKAEQFGDVLLLVVHEPPAAGDGEGEELQIVVGQGWLVTSHSASSTMHAAPPAACRRGDLDQNGAMAIVTELLGAVADLHARAADGLEEVVLGDEERVLETDDRETLAVLRAAAHVRRRIAHERRRVGQLRDVLGGVVRRELVDTKRTNELDLELRDVYDHILRTHDDLDLLHERMSTLAETRLALVAYRQNEITKRLSAWAAVLLVPTVVTGWFGQNFHHLVGLSWRYGEIYALALIVAICSVLVVGFRRAGWL